MQATKGRTCNNKVVITQMSQPYPWDHLRFTFKTSNKTKGALTLDVKDSSIKSPNS